MKNVGTPYELSGLPRLYQEYVGHDNNRDAYMLNMIESRVLEHTWRQWEPQIIYVHHQIGAVPDAHLAAAVFRAGRHRRAVPDVARSEHDRHGDRARRSTSAARSARRTWARRSTRGIPGYIDYAPNFKNIAAFWTETALYQYATPHEYTIDDFPAEHARPAAAEPLLEPVAAGLVAPARRGRLHGDGVARGDRVRVEVQGLAADQPLPGRPRSDRARREEGAVRLRRPAGAARSGRRGRAAAPPRVRRRARVAADRRRSTIDGETFPGRHLGRSRPTRNSPRWRAKCSTSSVSRPARSIPAVRPSVRTTPPAGRCRCRWAFASSPRRRR